MNKDAISSGDSDDLEALFDSIVRANQPSEAAPAAPVAQEKTAPVVEAFSMENLPEPASSMFNKVGQLTRQLHDALRELGYDKALEKAAGALPDAKDRLTYIANMTEQAANRALNAVDTAKPMQDRMEEDSQRLSAQWDRLFDKQLSLDEFKVLAQQTRDFLRQVPANTKGTNDQLLEIMMAQDFQDLTGQVIKKIVGMAQEMEGSLYGFLVEFSPHASKAGAAPEVSLVNGPVINPEGRSDVVSSQQQVDDLLASLGF